jgi:hypothetical protein
MNKIPLFLIQQIKEYLPEYYKINKDIKNIYDTCIKQINDRIKVFKIYCSSNSYINLELYQFILHKSRIKFYINYPNSKRVYLYKSKLKNVFIKDYDILDMILI